MIELENFHVDFHESVIRGMRNPLNSWGMSDSIFSEDGQVITLGERDLKLMRSLAKAGGSESKFRRCITVSFDITAPLYWWKEYDTYKVGTVTNSCSTMHKLTAQPYRFGDFSFEWLDDADAPSLLAKSIMYHMNQLRELYLETGDSKYWWMIIQIMPASYNQKRTVTLNYEVLSHMIHDRKRHKMKEWRLFCTDILTNLPYSELIEL